MAKILSIRQDKKSKSCNICGYPAYLTYEEENSQTGKRETKTIYVRCLGHEQLHPSKWNLHPDHDKYQSYHGRQVQIQARKALTK